MPMISAASYPTQTEPTVQPAATPGPDYQSIPAATPNAFGAHIGAAQERLGGAFEQAGDQLAAVALQRQRLTNQVASDQATNYTMDQVTKILHGDPNVPGDVGFYGKKGIDAVNSRQSTAQSLDDIINKTRATLTNPRQQLEFDNQTRRMRNYWMGEIGRHYDQQLTVSAVNSAKAGQDLAGQGMSSAAANGDMAGFSLNVENMMKAKIREGQAQGWTQEQYDAALGDVRSLATKQWVTSTAVKDPAAAKEFLEHNKDALRGEEYAQLSRMVKDHHDAAVADKFVSGMQGRGLARGGAVGGAIQYEAAGPHATEAVDTFKKAGWTDAAIQGALANGQNEGGFHEAWKPGDNGTSFGHWQFHRGGEYEGFMQFSGGAATTQKQAEYLVQRMEQIHPGFGQITDPKQAADIIEREFERPKVVTGNRYQGPVSVGGGAPDTATTTQTGAQATPAAATTAPPAINRTGLPPLAEQFDEIDKSSLSDDQKRLAKDNAAKRYTVLEADAARTERLRNEADKAHVEQAENEIFKDVYSATPKITPQMVANDPRFNSNPVRRENMIRLINDPPGSAVPAHQSNALAMSLIQRMQPNYTGQDKVTSSDQIYDQIKGLNRSDFTFVMNQFHGQQQLGGETIRQQRADLLKNYQGQIVGLINDPHLNPDGFARLYRYEHFIQSKIDDYQKTGKNPQELFDPKSPAFLASPDTLKGFAPTAHELLRDPQTGAAVDLSKFSDGDLIAAVKQGKVNRELARVELARRIEEGRTTPPAAPPIR
jgi:hypothetical protein